jgi:hypothetical protein
MVFASLFLWRWNWGFEPTPELIMGFWLLINLGVDFGLGRRSRQRLRAEFRVLALRRYADQPAHPLWRQLGLAWGRWWLR